MIIVWNNGKAISYNQMESNNTIRVHTITIVGVITVLKNVHPLNMVAIFFNCIFRYEFNHNHYMI